MLGLYIHIPFCIKKCSYCDFVSMEGTVLVGSYVRALLREIRIAGKLYREKVNSVFIGGGTPSYLNESVITKIMNAVRGNFDVADDAEITMECNPCSLTPQKLRQYRQDGVNRLSIGLQAVQPAHLATLGRRHTMEQFDDAYDMARAAGFNNINIDIIYALPGQTLDEWLETVYHVLYKRPEHVSAYALKIEADTPMGVRLEAGEIEAADEDTDADMYHATRNALADKGYIHYEISNFALPGMECLHNLKYWNMSNYLGLGAAAHSCIERLRFANTTDVRAYIGNLEKNKLQYASSEFIGDGQRKFEYLMLKLRLRAGIALSEYKSEFGEELETALEREVKQACLCGLATLQSGRFAPTPKGFALQNQLVHMMTANM